MTHRDILLDLFFQVTDYTPKDVQFTDYNPALFAVDDFAILHVKIKGGDYYSFSNDGGTMHLIKREHDER